MTTKTKSILLAVAAVGTLMCAAQAQAGGHVAWSVGINLPPVGVAVGNAPAYPVYAPAPAYPVYAPAPVYVEPAPVYAPAPVYYGYRAAPVVYGGYGHGYYHRHGYYNRPVPVYAPYPQRHWR